MEQKTKVEARAGQQDMLITRTFDLPVELLFKAYTEAELLSQWMGTKVLMLESKPLGAYRLETRDPKGNLAFIAKGVIHEYIPDEKIIRTFEMDGTPFGVQLEVYQFSRLSEAQSKLHMHVIYESAGQRDEVLKLPFAKGINLAHHRMEEMMQKMKKEG